MDENKPFSGLMSTYMLRSPKACPQSISRKRIDYGITLLIRGLYLAAQLCCMERCVAPVSAIQRISLLLVVCF